MTITALRRSAPDAEEQAHAPAVSDEVRARAEENVFRTLRDWQLEPYGPGLSVPIPDPELRELARVATFAAWSEFAIARQIETLDREAS